MANSGPSLPLAVGGCLHAIVGTLEQIGLATLFSVPLGVAAALFLAEVGGPLARPVRTIVEAMTALPDLIAGLFIYVLFILSLHFVKCGLHGRPGAERDDDADHHQGIRGGDQAGAGHAAGGLASARRQPVANGVERDPAHRPLGPGHRGRAGHGPGHRRDRRGAVHGRVHQDAELNPLSGPQINLPLFIWNYAHNEAHIHADLQRGFGGAFVLVVLVLGLFTAARMIGGSAPGEMNQAGSANRPSGDADAAGPCSMTIRARAFVRWQAEPRSPFGARGAPFWTWPGLLLAVAWSFPAAADLTGSTPSHSVRTRGPA